MSTSLDDQELRFARAAIRRGIVDPESLGRALARVQDSRGRGKSMRLEDALREEGAPDGEIRSIREALRRSKAKPPIPGYRLQEEIGQGAIGAVFRAKQVSLDRVVALKLLPKVLVQDRREVDRFLREARLAATLAHPGIVRVFEVGETADRYFLSMEYVPGDSLAARVARQGVLPAGRALAMARDAAAALAHAHARGVIHRDLKPANVMLAADGSVKIVDLGLARGIAGVPAERITEIGVLVGTPEFMAPEQARDPASVDGRADVWALGATLHFALAGTPPFQGRTTMDVLAKLLRNERALLREARPDLPPAVASWIDRAMAFDPADRFPDAASAGRGLEEILEALPESERSWHEKVDDTRVGGPRPAPEEPAPPAGKARILILVLAAGVLVGTGVTALLLPRGHGPGDAGSYVPDEAQAAAWKPIAVQNEEKARTLFEEAERYEKRHPADPPGALRRYREIAEQYPGTLAAYRARDAAEKMERRVRTGKGGGR